MDERTLLSPCPCSRSPDSGLVPVTVSGGPTPECERWGSWSSGPVSPKDDRSHVGTTVDGDGEPRPYFEGWVSVRITPGDTKREHTTLRPSLAHRVSRPPVEGPWEAPRSETPGGTWESGEGWGWVDLALVPDNLRGPSWCHLRGSGPKERVLSRPSSTRGTSPTCRHVPPHWFQFVHSHPTPPTVTSPTGPRQFLGSGEEEGSPFPTFGTDRPRPQPTGESISVLQDDQRRRGHEDVPPVELWVRPSCPVRSLEDTHTRSCRTRVWGRTVGYNVQVSVAGWDKVQGVLTSLYRQYKTVPVPCSYADYRRVSWVRGLPGTGPLGVFPRHGFSHVRVHPGTGPSRYGSYQVLVLPE